MATASGFPNALKTAARPRWSHRDPVEEGNPFLPDDARHRAWQEGTTRAGEALRRMDDELDASDTGEFLYEDRVVELAGMRFDVWAHRCGSVVTNQAALEDYGQWLAFYRTNWIEYVADTCPTLDVSVKLAATLKARARTRQALARANLRSSQP